MPAVTQAAAATRAQPNRSWKATLPMIAATTMLDSRSAATVVSTPRSGHQAVGQRGQPAAEQADGPQRGSAGRTGGSVRIVPPGLARRDVGEPWGADTG